VAKRRICQIDKKSGHTTKEVALRSSGSLERKHHSRGEKKGTKKQLIIRKEVRSSLGSSGTRGSRGRE